MKKKYSRTLTVLIIVFVLLFIYYLYLITVPLGPKNPITMIFFPILFLVYVFLTFNFNLSSIKKGYFSKNQALKFYKSCQDLKINKPSKINQKDCEEVYLTVFGTKEYTGNGDLLTHMTKVYNSGRELSKKQ